MEVTVRYIGGEPTKAVAVSDGICRCREKKADTMGTSLWEGESPGYLAYHEAGHAAAFWSQGFALAYVTIVGYEQQPRPHTQPVDVTIGKYGQKVLTRVSGLIAGYWFNRQGLTDAGIVELLVGSPDNHFELVGMFSGRRTRLSRVPLLGPGEDLEWVGAEDTDRPFTPEGAVVFWRQCEWFVRSVSPAIGAIAGEVLRRGRISGDDADVLASTAMAGCPAAWIPPWTAEE